MSPRGFACWVTRHKKVMALVLLTIVAFGWAVWSSIGLVQGAHKRTAEAAESRRYICEQINARALGPLHGLLEQAQTVASRNPLPPGLTDELRRYYEAQRSQADEFYRLWVSQTEPIDCSSLPGAP